MVKIAHAKNADAIVHLDKRLRDVTIKHMLHYACIRHRHVENTTTKLENMYDV